MTGKKRKCEEIVEESEVLVELALFPGCPGEDKMPRTSFHASQRKKVPVELVLFDLSPRTTNETDANLGMERNAANPARIEDLGEMVFKKRLTKSDVSPMSRLLLASNWVRKHVLPFLGDDVVEKVDSGCHVDVTVRDLDTVTQHRMGFKRWTSSNSYVLIKRWNIDFVTRRDMKDGDEIGLFWNNSMFHFSLLNRAPPN